MVYARPHTDDPTKNKPRIAVLTSGGDSPGMNACIRAIVRSSIYENLEVVGIHNGYDGLIRGKLNLLTLRSVGNIIQRGGTVLGSSRSQEFRTAAGRKKAFHVLKAWRINKLIVLGGDGTMTGAKILSKEFPVQVVGIPCTIDNDLAETDFSIGFDTALNTAVECIDKIRDTADSHGRVFIVEVMGHHSGHLALETALAVGAEYVVIPEVKFRPAELIRKIKNGIERGKTGSIVIVSERDKPGFAFPLSKHIKHHIKRDVRALVLGHLQRGGSPTATDRNLASRMGARAVDALIRGKSRIMVGILDNQMVEKSFSKVIGRMHEPHLETLALVDQLSI